MPEFGLTDKAKIAAYIATQYENKHNEPLKFHPDRGAPQDIQINFDLKQYEGGIVKKLYDLLNTINAKIGKNGAGHDQLYTVAQGFESIIHDRWKEATYTVIMDGQPAAILKSIAEKDPEGLQKATDRLKQGRS